MFSIYASNKSQKFFTVNKTEISSNDTLELSINLDAILYQKFSVKIESSATMDNVQTEDQGVTINNENNQISMEIDKDKLNNISNIKLDYIIPESVNVGDGIKIVATITNSENDEEKESIEAQVKVIENEANIENSNNNNKLNNNEQIDINKDNKQQDEKQQSGNMKNNMGNNGLSNNNQNNSTKIGNGSIATGSSNTKTVTYNGSSNNYLKKLEVSGYTFTSEFSKENTNYFVTVGNDVESIKLTAKSENLDAKVTIYGNSNLKEGINKVLVYVTAENGSVRIYRIYVIKT